MPRPLPRIAAEDLEPAHALLFGRSVFTGAALARELGMKDVTLWSWFSRRGLTPPDARRVADRMAQWASRLLDVSNRLRILADAVDGPNEEAPAAE